MDESCHAPHSAGDGSCYIHRRVTMNTCMSHVMHMDKSSHTPHNSEERVMLHPQMSHVTHMRESYHTYGWVMSHTLECKNAARRSAKESSGWKHNKMPAMHMCDMTRSYNWHVSFKCVTSLVRMCDGIVIWPIHSAIWLIQMCDTTHSYLRISMALSMHTATHCNTLQHTATHCNKMTSVPRGRAHITRGAAIICRLEEMSGLFRKTAPQNLDYFQKRPDIVRSLLWSGYD